MKLVNQTPFSVGWTQGFTAQGRELVAVATRATYRLSGGPEPTLAPTQQPVLDADVLGVDPARNAPVHENDLAHYKPRCDVLVHACAYAPGGVPLPRVDIAMRVGSCQKSFRVTGPRVWTHSRLGGALASSPLPFVRQEITYDLAFGGTDIDPDDPSRFEVYMPNPCGSGFCHYTKNLDQMRLAQTEEIAAPIANPRDNYRPMALGPIGRSWAPRYTYAGTYDQRWRDERLPFFPDDFDYQYFQAAPADQQIPHPVGGESIVLINLDPSGQLVSTIPRQGVHIVFVRHRDKDEVLPAKLDTIVIEPEHDRLTLVWRAFAQMKRDAFELREIVVLDDDPVSLARDRARRSGKPHYASLDDAIQARKKGGR
jgi:hypothetical protein